MTPIIISLSVAAGVIGTVIVCKFIQAWEWQRWRRKHQERMDAERRRKGITRKW